MTQPNLGPTSGRPFAFMNLVTYSLGLLPPLLLCSFWFSLDRAYPIHDASAYLLDVVPLLKALWNGTGASPGMFYWVRSWKPIPLPNLLVPFLWVTHDIRFSVACFNLFVYAIFLFYLIRIFKRYLSAFAAIPAVWFIGTLPWVLMSAHHFMCELPFMAAGLAAYFYLLEADWLQSARRSALLGIFLAAAFSIRPFEGLMSVGLVYIYFIVRAHREGKISRTDIAAAAAMTLYVLSVPAFFSLYPKPVYLWGLSAGWCSLIMVRQWQAAKGRLAKNFLRTNTLFLSIFLFWFAPFYKDLYEWAFASTFGSRVVRVPSAFWGDALNAGMGPTLVLAALAVGVWAIGRRKSTTPPDFKPLLAISILSFGSALIGAMSHSAEIRYHYLGFTFLEIFLVILVLGNDAVEARRLKWVVLLLFTGHGYWVIDTMSGGIWGRDRAGFYCRSDWNSGCYGGTFAPTRQSDGIDSMLAKISQVIDLRRDAKVYAFMQFREFSPEINRFVLVSTEKGYRASYDFPYEAAGQDWRNPKFDWRNLPGDYWIIGLIRQGEPLSAFSNSQDFDSMVKELIRSWRTDELENHGLSLAGVIHVDEQDGDFLLIKKGSHGPKI